MNLWSQCVYNICDEILFCIRIGILMLLTYKPASDIGGHGFCAGKVLNVIHILYQFLIIFCVKTFFCKHFCLKYFFDIILCCIIAILKSVWFLVKSITRILSYKRYFRSFLQKLRSEKFWHITYYFRQRIFLELR